MIKEISVNEISEMIQDKYGNGSIDYVIVGDIAHQWHPKKHVVGIGGVMTVGYEVY